MPSHLFDSLRQPHVHHARELRVAQEDLGHRRLGRIVRLLRLGLREQQRCMQRVSVLGPLLTLDAQLLLCAGEREGRRLLLLDHLAHELHHALLVLRRRPGQRRLARRVERRARTPLLLFERPAEIVHERLDLLIELDHVRLRAAQPLLRLRRTRAGATRAALGLISELEILGGLALGSLERLAHLGARSPLELELLDHPGELLLGGLGSLLRRPPRRLRLARLPERRDDALRLRLPRRRLLGLGAHDGALRFLPGAHDGALRLLPGAHVVVDMADGALLAQRRCDGSGDGSGDIASRTPW